jgi:polysaccharide biosynthesis/export protein
MSLIPPQKIAIKAFFISRCFGLLIVCAFVQLVACAGPSGGSSFSTPSSSVPANQPPAGSVVASPYSSDQSDLMRVGDLLVIRLTGVPDEAQGTYEAKIDESGQISMPHIGGIPAAGLSTVQIKEKIETLYKLQKIYTNPNITVVSQQARFVGVTGEVRAPQRMFHTKDLTALGAIANCGGFTDYANRRRVRVLRGSQVIEFNATEALSNPSRDIPLIPDDKIQVDRSIF